MKCAIMQVTYLPWIGYFSLIDSVDYFVLDDVSSKDLAGRIEIVFLVNGKEHNLIVPVVRTGLDTLIKDALIDQSQKWRKNHIKSLEQAYSKTQYKDILNQLKQIISDETITRLSDLNMHIINLVVGLLGIKTKLLVSSDFKLSANDRSNRLLDICNSLGCDEYVSPLGSKEYLFEDKFHENNSEIKLSFIDFNLEAYPQMNGDDFISHLSIFDLLLNMGEDFSAEYIYNVKRIKSYELTQEL